MDSITIVFLLWLAKFIIWPYPHTVDIEYDNIVDKIVLLNRIVCFGPLLCCFRGLLYKVVGMANSFHNRPSAEIYIWRLSWYSI